MRLTFESHKLDEEALVVAVAPSSIGVKVASAVLM